MRSACTPRPAPSRESTHSDFREALARFASGVTIVTTADQQGRWWGFTASSFCSVSLDPPLILVCLSRQADSYSAFLAAENFTVNVLCARHEALATRFATKSQDKFSGGEFVAHPSGPPVLPDALAVMRCTVHDRLDGGDHVILLGLVGEANVGNGPAVVHYHRAFRRLAGPAGPESQRPA